jgi:hypothetical protein
MARLPVLIRQNEVFNLVVQGKSYTQICEQLGVSEDTVARDMQAISQQVQELVRQRAGEILAAAIAQLSEVIATAWREYHLELERERDWFGGELDYPTQVEEIAETEKGMLTSLKTSRARPGWRSNRAKYLEIVLNATRELTELTGVKRHVVEIQTKSIGPGVAISAEDLSDDELAALIAGGSPGALAA